MDKLIGHWMFMNKSWWWSAATQKENNNTQSISKTKTRHHSEAPNSVAYSNVENIDNRFSEEDEEKLTFQTKRVNRLLRKRRGPISLFINFQQGESFKQVRCFECKKSSHIKSDCPSLKKDFKRGDQKEKEMMATWDDKFIVFW